MGVLNVTPDSFSDGGRFVTPAVALEHGRAMAAAGAAIIDVGGESTRPGAAPVGLAEELDRVVPVIAALAAELEVPISVDTSRPEVMREAVRAGARMINDVRALRRPGALEAAAELAVPVCLMHMQGEPGTMQREPRYRDVVAEVRAFLLARAEACREAGIGRERILIDPGFGFGKTLAHNQRLLARLEVLAASGYPVLVGLSRKSMIGALTGRPTGERASASVVLALEAARRGAAVLRVHDVAATCEGLRLLEWVAAGGDEDG